MTDNRTIAQSIVSFMAFSEGLKKELRHSYLSDKRQESVAEHSWQMAMMALMSYPYLSKPVDITRVLKMIIVHDLAEAEVGDVSYLDQLATPSLKEIKMQHEMEVMEKVKLMLPSPISEEIYALWYEYEERITDEARFVKALDDLEVQVQHNLASFDTWEEKEFDLTFTKIDRNCGHDPFLMTLANSIVQNASVKMADAGYDVNAIRKRATA
jgi:putative hydrolase of HD superfamily